MCENEKDEALFCYFYEYVLSFSHAFKEFAVQTYDSGAIAKQMSVKTAIITSILMSCVPYVENNL